MDLAVILNPLQAAAAAYVAARLLQVRRTSPLPALLYYAVQVALGQLLLTFAASSKKAYFWTFIFLEPFGWLAAVLVVRELFTVVFANYPGIRSAGRTASYVAVGISALVLLAVSVFFPAPGNQVSSKLYYFTLMDRSLDLTLAILILVIAVVLSRYPLQLRFNTWLSASVFCAIFLSEGIARLFDSISRLLFARWVDLGQAFLMALLLFGWAVLLRAQDSIPVRRAVSPLREKQLLQQLSAVNSMLARAGRR